MRAQHVPHALPSFPVYSIGFISDDKVAVGGGGGASKSGIKNKLVRLRLPALLDVVCLSLGFI